MAPCNNHPAASHGGSGDCKAIVLKRRARALPTNPPAGAGANSTAKLNYPTRQHWPDSTGHTGPARQCVSDGSGHPVLVGQYWSDGAGLRALARQGGPGGSGQAALVSVALQRRAPALSAIPPAGPRLFPQYGGRGRGNYSGVFQEGVQNHSGPFPPSPLKRPAPHSSDADLSRPRRPGPASKPRTPLPSPCCASGALAPLPCNRRVWGSGQNHFLVPSTSMSVCSKGTRIRLRRRHHLPPSPV